MARTVIVGGGYWGKNLIRAFHELGAPIAICDADRSLEAGYRAAYPDTPFTADFPSALEDPDVGSVVLATPAATHARLAARALASGRDVFVEKPLALSVRDGERLVAAAAKAGRILMVGHILHYHPAVVRLKELVRSGALGRLRYIYSNRLNIGRIRHEENILWSFAPHDISLMLSLTGAAPRAVRSFGGVYLPHAVEDVTVTCLSFPGNVSGHIFVSWLNPFKEQKFVAVGAEAMAVFDDTNPDRKLTVFRHRITWSGSEPPSIERADGETQEIPREEPLKRECAHFLACVASRTPPLTDGAEGLAVLRVLDAAGRSLKRNRREDA